MMTLVCDRKQLSLQTVWKQDQSEIRQRIREDEEEHEDDQQEEGGRIRQRIRSEDQEEAICV